MAKKMRLDVVTVAVREVIAATDAGGDVHIAADRAQVKHRLTYEEREQLMWEYDASCEASART